jgi:hypothetical protein
MASPPLVDRMEKMDACRILVEKSVEERLLGRLRHI